MFQSYKQIIEYASLSKRCFLVKNLLKCRVIGQTGHANISFTYYMDLNLICLNLEGFCDLACKLPWQVRLDVLGFDS